MTCARATQQIQELIDGTLGPIRRSELEQHLDECASGRALFDDLQKVRDAAASIPALEPPDHVWIQIAGRLRQEGRVHDRPQPVRPRRLQYAWLGLAAALVIAVGAAMLYVIVPDNQPGVDSPATTAGNAAATDSVQSGVEDLRQAEKLLQSGVAKLREGLGSDGQSLPAPVTATLESNLKILDQAIAESSAAVQAEPQNVAARTSLFDSLQRKISLLQDTIALMNEMRKGNAAGVAQVVEGVNKS
jgi:putative zinc finger protein